MRNVFLFFFPLTLSYTDFTEFSGFNFKNPQIMPVFKAHKMFCKRLLRSQTVDTDKKQQRHLKQSLHVRAGVFAGGKAALSVTKRRFLCLQGNGRWQCRDAELAALAVWDLRHTQSMTGFTGWEWEGDTGRRQLMGGRKQRDSKEALPG